MNGFNERILCAERLGAKTEVKYITVEMWTSNLVSMTAFVENPSSVRWSSKNTKDNQPI